VNQTSLVVSAAREEVGDRDDQQYDDASQKVVRRAELETCARIEYVPFLDLKLMANHTYSAAGLSSING
jgi:hypothetical protein